MFFTKDFTVDFLKQFVRLSANRLKKFYSSWCVFSFKFYCEIYVKKLREHICAVRQTMSNEKTRTLLGIKEKRALPECQETQALQVLVAHWAP
jgi:hypothetical protein